MKSEIKLFIIAASFFGAIIFSQPLQSQPLYKKHMLDLNINYYQVCEEAEDYFSKIDRHKKGSGWKNFLRWQYENK